MSEIKDEEHVNVLDESTDEEEYVEEDLTEEKDRICQFFRLSYQKDKEDHPFFGRAYECEDCRGTGCKDCLMDDCWEERVADNVFLCRGCYRWDQIRADIG